MSLVCDFIVKKRVEFEIYNIMYNLGEIATYINN